MAERWGAGSQSSIGAVWVLGWEVLGWEVGCRGAEA